MGKILTSRNLLLYLGFFLLFVILIVANSFSYIGSLMSDKLYGNQLTLDSVLIINIDDASINKIGRWPWDRAVYSDLLTKLKDAKAVGIDVSFFEPSANDKALSSKLNSMNNVVLASEINNNVFFKPIFNSTSGYVNLVTDSDGITRAVKVGLSNSSLPFAFEVYKKYSQKNTFQKNKYLINFAAEPDSFNSISFYDALNSNISVKNKVVLIGATAPNLHDNYFVPTSNGIPMSGVEIHANILQNLILNNFLAEQGNLSIILLVLISSFAGFFILSRLKVYYTLAVLILIIVIYSLIGIYLFNNNNYLLDLFYFPISLLVFTSAGTAVNYLEEKKQSAYLTDAFSKYVSKDLLSELLSKKQQLKLGGAKREITIFFSDIRGFTSISEKLTPEKLVHLINEYLTAMTTIIMENKGTVDKFIGDAIMAFWNAPFLEKEHPKLACLSAIAQVKALKKLKSGWKKQKLPEINIGCGINTGEDVIGNMGSEDRFDYTAMGDSVNLSSRLEGLTKQYQVNIIISESTYQRVHSELKCRLLDAVKVKGKNIPIKIYELIVDENNEEFIKQFEKALESYFKSQFKKAKSEFKKALVLKEDHTAKMFIERCDAYIQNPPKNWDGSFQAKEK
jgi:adenylate cyclase